MTRTKLIWIVRWVFLEKEVYGGITDPTTVDNDSSFI